MIIIRKVIMKVTIAMLLAIAVSLLWYFRPSYVKLELVACLQSPSIDVNEGKEDFRSELHWWFIDSYFDLETILFDGHVSPYSNAQINNLKKLKNWGIDFDELGIDFDENNVILAFSREIKKMKFKRAYWFPYHTIGTVRTVMSKNFAPNTIYVYRIPKYDVREDERAFSETFLEK